MAFSAFAQRAGPNAAFLFGFGKTPTAAAPTKSLSGTAVSPSILLGQKDNEGISTPQANASSPQAAAHAACHHTEPKEPQAGEHAISHDIEGSLQQGLPEEEVGAASVAARLPLDGEGEGEEDAAPAHTEGEEEGEADPDVSMVMAMKGSIAQSFADMTETLCDGMLAVVGMKKTLKDNIQSLTAEAAEVAGKKRARIADMVSTVEKKLRMLKEIETGALGAGDGRGEEEEEDRDDEEEEEEEDEQQAREVGHVGSEGEQHMASGAEEHPASEEAAQ